MAWNLKNLPLLNCSRTCQGETRLQLPEIFFSRLKFPGVSARYKIHHELSLMHCYRVIFIGNAANASVTYLIAKKMIYLYPKGYNMAAFLNCVNTGTFLKTMV